MLGDDFYNIKMTKHHVRGLIGGKGGLVMVCGMLICCCGSGVGWCGGWMERRGVICLDCNPSSLSPPPMQWNGILINHSHNVCVSNNLVPIWVGDMEVGVGKGIGCCLSPSFVSFVKKQPQPL